MNHIHPFLALKDHHGAPVQRFFIQNRGSDADIITIFSTENLHYPWEDDYYEHPFGNVFKQKGAGGGGGPDEEIFPVSVQKALFIAGEKMMAMNTLIL